MANKPLNGVIFPGLEGDTYFVPDPADHQHSAADVGTYDSDKIDSLLDGKAPADHNHDDDYATKDHTHDAPDYALNDHNHDDDYAPKDHSHTVKDIGTYDSATIDRLTSGKASANHNHDDSYASKNHDHIGVYAGVDHNHDNVYSETGHNHDDAYIAKGTTVQGKLTRKDDPRTNGGTNVKEYIASGLAKLFVVCVAHRGYTGPAFIGVVDFYQIPVADDDYDAMVINVGDYPDPYSDDVYAKIPIQLLARRNSDDRPVFSVNDPNCYIKSVASYL